MTYRELLDAAGYNNAAPGGEATLVTQDSRKVQPGAVFVCVKGRTSDGHKFAKAALEAGAGLVITQHPLGLGKEVTLPDTRAAYAALCAAFFGNPAHKLVLVAVTGTNGKTTTTSVLKQTLKAQGVVCGLIGTIQSEIDEVEIPAKFTTPEPWDLNALFARMLAGGCTHVVMEASSQALEQGRLHGLQFALGVFTNLTRDHLDYHGDMESYYQAKKLLFSQCDAMLVNCDDEAGQRLLRECTLGKKYSYSTEDTADFAARDIRLRPDGVRFALLGEDYLLPVSFAMPGAYSVYNALAAAGASILLGFAPGATAAALQSVRGVSGRCEVLHSGSFTVIRDFAHTSDAIEKLLETLRPFVTGRMVVVYGSCGERDPDKRPKMAQSATAYGDKVYVTEDNPRSESQDKIYADALPALDASGKPYVLQPDRETAVRMALGELREGDMLVLCGKGHEDYQALDGYTVYMSERDIVHSWLRENKA